MQVKLKTSLCSGATIAALGMFSIVAQVLILRDFMFVFEGSEIAIGVFLFTWLGWIGIGGIFWRVSRLLRWSGNCFLVLVLLYPLSYVLEKSMLINASSILGTHPFELSGLLNLLCGATVFSFPVSFMTGLLFIGAVEWCSNLKTEVGLIYILETLGSAIGASFAVILIICGCCDETIFGISSMILFCCAGVNIVWLDRNRGAVCVLILLAGGVLILLLLDGFTQQWSKYNDIKYWQKTAGAEKYSGSFQTPQAKYLYGGDANKLTLTCFGSACDALNFPESVVSDVSYCFSQKPTAEKVLVIAQGGFALSSIFSGLPKVAEVIWLETDPGYPQKIISILPSNFFPISSKLKMPEQDIIQWLKRNQNHRYDLIVIRLPQPNLLVLSRYFETFFMELLYGALHEKGVVSFAFTGGENYLSETNAGIGGILLNELGNKFKYVVLQPGEKSYFFASNYNEITTEPSVLRARLNSFSNDVIKSFPSNYLDIVYDPLRIEQQMEKYRNAWGKIANVSSNNRAFAVDFLFSTALTIKKTTGKTISPLMLIENCYLVLAAIMVLITLFFGISGVITIRSQRHQQLAGAYCSADKMLGNIMICVYVFNGSAIIIALNVLLLISFQIEYGSLFLYFGLLLTIFMTGMLLGGISAEFCRTITLVTAIFLIIVVAVIWWWLLTYQWGSIVYILLNGVLGWIGGIFLPRAASIFRQRNGNAGVTAGWLIMADYAGGACGGIISGIILIPLFGINMSLLAVIYIAVLMLCLPIIVNFMKIREKT
jgi:hypothetical protein